MNINKLFLLVKNFLFPASCALCCNALFYADEIKYGICNNCIHSFEVINEARCSICGKHLISEIDTCLSCRKQEIKRTYNKLWVLYPYTGKYRKLLASYKFEKNIPLANFFAEKIMALINENPVLKDAVIVPVPPRYAKIKTTGWDQVDKLVKTLEKIYINLTVCKCLKRLKSKVQKNLNRMERLDNLKGRIFFDNKKAQKKDMFFSGNTPKPALLIDDVITTGSTIEVCSQVLKENGVQEVYGLCLFYD